MMRKNAAAENDGVRPGETVFADLDWLRGLPAGIQIDGVSEQLRAESADRRKRANADARRAINQVPAADSRVAFDDQLRPSLGLMREMPTGPARKTGDPVQMPDDSVRAEMEQIDILAQRQVPDPRAFFHHEFFRKNPREADVARRMDRIAELVFEKRAAQSPRQEKR